MGPPVGPGPGTPLLAVDRPEIAVLVSPLVPNCDAMLFEIACVGRSLQKPQQLVDDRDILALIHFAAKRNDPNINLSSSHRRLIQFEPHAKVPTLLNHWRFLQGELLYDVKLGFSRVPARDSASNATFPFGGT